MQNQNINSNEYLNYARILTSNAKLCIFVSSLRRILLEKIQISDFGKI
jgi:hypothetical protein